VYVAVAAMSPYSFRGNATVSSTLERCNAANAARARARAHAHASWQSRCFRRRLLVRVDAVAVAVAFVVAGVTTSR
jgi:hypothetical protein